jgi:hypothetical protein
MKLVKLFAIALIIAVFSSCSLVKETYYNKLDKEEQKLYTPKFLDMKNEELNSEGVFSLNLDEFKTLAKNSSNKHNLIFFYQLYCGASYEFVHQLAENIKLSDFDFFFISGHDWVWKYNYEDFVENSTIKRMFLLDVNQYGEIEGWAENKTYFKRITAFYDDLKNDFKGNYDDLDINSVPTVIICDNDSNILLEFDPFNCDGNKDCDEKEKAFYNSLDSLLNSKLSFE